jgi:starch phosphorylase
MRINVKVHLGDLTPSDVAVELYVGRVNMNGELIEGRPIPMSEIGNPVDGVYTYALDTSIGRSGLHGFTVRVRPYHPDMPVPFLPGLITWAEGSEVAQATAV